MAEVGWKLHRVDDGLAKLIATPHMRIQAGRGRNIALSTPGMEMAVGIRTCSSGFRRRRAELLTAGSRVGLQNRA
jgi:hypothetical protein